MSVILEKHSEYKMVSNTFNKEKAVQFHKRLQ